MKVQNFSSLIAEMKSVAAGKAKASRDAGTTSVESVDVLVRLLTPENRLLLRLIQQKHPQSIVELEKLSGRKGPNLTRTLSKLEAAGLIELRTEKRRKIPRVALKEILIRIDPCQQTDQIAFA